MTEAESLAFVAGLVGGVVPPWAFEDAFQAGYEGYLVAKVKYRTGNFYAYASSYVRGYARKEMQRTLSATGSVRMYGRGELPEEEETYEPDPSARLDVERLLRRLPRLADLAENRFLGVKLKDIATRQGLPENTHWNRVQKAMRDARRMCECG